MVSTSTPKGEVAVVANIGVGGGDADTISVIDLKLNPPRVVSTYTVGQTPEGIKMSPDGKYVAVTVMNGTNKPSDSPFFNGSGILQIWTRNGTQLSKSAEMPIGQMVPGHRLVRQQPHAAGAVHGRGGDRGRPLHRPRAGTGGRHQDQGRSGRHPHRRAVAVGLAGRAAVGTREARPPRVGAAARSV